MDIIILIFLVVRIGQYVKGKGYSPVKWRLWVIIAWVVSEIGILLIAYGMFKIALVPAVVLAYCGAFTGYYIVYQKAKQLPVLDNQDNWIDNIGNDNL